MRRSQVRLTRAQLVDMAEQFFDPPTDLFAFRAQGV
jgi:hypothetical protein